MVKGTQVSSVFQCVWAKYSPSVIYVKLYKLQRETAKWKELTRWWKEWEK